MRLSLTRHCSYVHVDMVCSRLCQVVELALTKLFDNFNLKELTGSMVDLMVSVNTKPEAWGETPEGTPKQVTPSRRPAITVRDKGHDSTYM